METVEQDAWVRLRDEAKLGRRIQGLAEYLLLVRIDAKENNVKPLEKYTRASISNTSFIKSKISIFGSPDRYDNLFLCDERARELGSKELVFHQVDIFMGSLRNGHNLHSANTLALATATWQPGLRTGLSAGAGPVQNEQTLTDIHTVMNKVLKECGLETREFDRYDILIPAKTAVTDVQPPITQG